MPRARGDGFRQIVTPVIFADQARVEALDSLAGYEGRRRGLGEVFEAELNAAILRVAEEPLAFPLYYRDLRCELALAAEPLVCWADEAMWDRVREKLARLAREDREFRVPCSPSHEYRMKPVATEGEVAFIEKRHGIRLPDDYREYVLTFANGGAGPYHGVYPLGYYKDAGELFRWDEGVFATSVAKPFALRGPWNLPAAYIEENLQGDATPQAERDAVDCLARVGLVLPPPTGKVIGKNPFTGEALVETLEMLIMNAAYSNDLMNGTVPIATQGCNLGVSLVVAGAERGNVWHDLRADSAGIVPASRSGMPRLTFLQWYEAWLDDSLASVLS